MEKRLEILSIEGVIVPRTERNPYLKVSYKGNGKEVSDKWNVKIYTSGSVVCNDETLLQELVDKGPKPVNTKLKVLQCDDSGWGFCLCGVLVGVADNVRVETAVIDLKWFRNPEFETKGYLKAYADAGLKLLKDKFQADPATHRIEICTGYINTTLKDELRRMGFDVRVVEVKGLLQDTLEGLFRKHVAEQCGKDLAYDPKLFSGKEISAKYYAVVDWAEKNAPHLLKSGWKSLCRR